MADRAPRILLVDDEQPIQTLLSFPLQRDGYDVVVASDGREALARFDELPPDLVVLDLMLPRMDGLEVCKRLRAKGETVPIIMLTAKSEEIDKVLGLELGADDYITKPFSMREFRSRVKAALRRSGMAHAETDGERVIDVRGLRIDPAKRSVTRDGEAIACTYVEFEILRALAQSPGRVYTRDMLLARVWGDSAFRDQRTIDVHIRHLREKIEGDPKDPEFIFTVRGVGYRFRDED
jgi:DNA-binding response OmpR family regulator